MPLVSFAHDILPLFRPIDIQHMAHAGVQLDKYDYMSQPQNAQNVLNYLNGTSKPQMPPDGPWTNDQISLFSKWITDGYQP